MKRIHRPVWLPVFLVAVSLLLGLPAALAQSDASQDALRARIDALLGGIEYAPTADEWTALGPDAAEILVAIANDASTLATRRARALSALAQFPGEATVTTARALLSDATTPVIVRRKAIGTLAVVDADAFSVVAPFLEDGDIQLRESAAVALVEMGTPAARQALDARLGVEKSEHLRQVIAAGLGR